LTRKFGSPLSLFASTAANVKGDEHHFATLMITYMMAHHIFWLNMVNHNDPFAYTLAQGPVIENLRNQSRRGLFPSGSTFNNYIIRQGGPRPGPAHYWYWNHPVQFVEAISKAYEQGITQWHPSLKTNPNKT
jgi:hypothetical protein